MRVTISVLKELWIWWVKTESWPVLTEGVGYAQGTVSAGWWAPTGYCGCRCEGPW